MPFCTKCGNEISQQDYEKFVGGGGLCQACYLTEPHKTIQNPEETTKKDQSFLTKSKTGIASIIFDLIGGLIIAIFYGSLQILYATPFTFIGTLLGILVIKTSLDQSKIAGIFGFLIGWILLFVSIWPVVELLAVLFGGGV